MLHVADRHCRCETKRSRDGRCEWSEPERALAEEAGQTQKLLPSWGQPASRRAMCMGVVQGIMG